MGTLNSKFRWIAKGHVWASIGVKSLWWLYSSTRSQAQFCRFSFRNSPRSSHWGWEEVGESCLYLSPRPSQGIRKSIIVKTCQTILSFMDQTFNLYGSDIARGRQCNSILIAEKEFCSALFQHCLKQREKGHQYTKERASRTQTEDTGA